MPSPLAHSAVAFVLLPLVPRDQLTALAPWRRRAFAAALVAGTIGPDVDFLLLAVSPALAYEVHGGPTHSFAAAALFGVIFAALCRPLTGFPVARLWLLGALAWASHVLLDALTPGRGVAMFWPLSDDRISSAAPLFLGVRHSDPLAIDRHALTAVSELPFVLLMWWGGRRIRTWNARGNENWACFLRDGGDGRSGP